MSWPEAERESWINHGGPRDPDRTKLVEGRDICVNLAFLGRTEAGTIVAVTRELLCGENGELQNLTEDGHTRLCVLQSR